MSPQTKSGATATEKQPWRENIEALLMAVVVAVTLKYFFLEISRIPSGSMQPTLMGNPELAINDRVMVDKLSYRFRDPKRFEVAVFKHPLERSRNMVKRIVGMPGEELEIRAGDLWVRPEGGEWAVLRRPEAIQERMWKSLDPGGWTPRGNPIRLAPGASVRYVSPNANSVMDHYLDGYPDGIRARLAALRPYRAQSRVGDLRVEGNVTASAGCLELVVELREGARTYRFILPGPGAAANVPARIEPGSDGFNVNFTAPKAVAAAEAWQMPTDESVEFAAENLDDRLDLALVVDRVAEVEVPFEENPISSIRLLVTGGPVELEGLEAFRDLHYLPGRDGTTLVKIPEGHYFMLGDNTLDSADGREWQAVTFRWDAADGEQVARGNLRKWENPARTSESVPELTYFFRDEWGERHSFAARSARESGPEPAPVVPRELIHGRVFSVFWPLAPWRDVWRFGWIR